MAADPQIAATKGPPSVPVSSGAFFVIHVDQAAAPEPKMTPQGITPMVLA